MPNNVGLLSQLDDPHDSWEIHMLFAPRVSMIPAPASVETDDPHDPWIVDRGLTQLSTVKSPIPAIPKSPLTPRPEDSST